MFDYITVIPARGGSKRIPRKNLRELCGFPLIQYSIAIAKTVCSNNKIFVSTDDAEISKIAEKCEVNVLHRNPETARDHSPAIDYLIDACNQLKQKGLNPEYLLLLQPTSPLRTTELIKNGLDLAEKTKKPFSSVVGIGTKKIFQVSLQDGYVHKKYPENSRSQELEPILFFNGSFYFLNISETVQKNSLLGQYPLGYEISDNDGNIDIDTLDDFHAAERLTKQTTVEIQNSNRPRGKILSIMNL